LSLWRTNVVLVAKLIEFGIPTMLVGRNEFYAVADGLADEPIERLAVRVRE